MPDRRRSRLLRPTALGPLVSLTLVAGLSGLGLARSVWGGPPADPEPTSDLAVDPTVEPAASNVVPDPADLPPADALPVDETAASVPAASSLRAKMEAGMAEIGELAVEARADEDLVRATCVLDKQDRANDVMDLGTSELLLIRDPNTSEQARSFALEKLDAASLRIDKLVEEAKACAGQQGPEDQVDITRNESDEPSEVPLADPSIGLGANPVPPPMDGGWPPAASPIE